MAFYRDTFTLLNFLLVQERNLTDIITFKQQSHIYKKKLRKKHAERTINHLCGTMERKNSVA
jgi:hypothetical protein